MAQNRLPNLARLVRSGTVSPLATTNPAESPVAWSSFITGSNPGKTGIFGFLSRDPHTYRPRYAPTRKTPAKRLANVFLLSPPQYHNNRRGRPFWDIASENGLRCLVLRMPESFPARQLNGALLAGMEIPDLRGSTGTFTLFTSDSSMAEADDKFIALRFHDGEAVVRLPGPNNWLHPGKAAASRPIHLRLLAAEDSLLVTTGGRTVRLGAGQWSPWLRVSFPLSPFSTIHGQVRFYLIALNPVIKLYASPVQPAPDAPLWPLSYPRDFAAHLQKVGGPYKTLGWQLDTWVLNEGILPEPAFLEDAFQSLRQEARLAVHALRHQSPDLAVIVFDGLDRLQHMFWRYSDPKHTLYSAEASRTSKTAIERYMVELDRIIGELTALAGPDALILVFSDHGFTSYRRNVNLNTFLAQKGFLVYRKPDFSGEPDWSRTRAYSLGLGHIYINLQGRERHGRVARDEFDSLRRQLTQALLRWTDPATGRSPVRHVFRADSIYSGPALAEAPDLLVALKPGYRISQQSSLGRAEKSAFSDNARRWSGDHASVDPAAVPGVLLANRPLNVSPPPSIMDLAPTILHYLNCDIPADMDGRNLLLSPQDAPGESAQSQQRSAKAQSSHPLLLIGLDGADWNRLSPLLRKGALPNLSRLMQSGSHGALQSLTPLISPMLWASIATGTKPEQHGVFDFFSVDPKSGKKEPVNRFQYRRRPIWSILSGRQKTVGVIGWLGSWPAEPLNGFMVTDRLGYLDFASRADLSSRKTDLVFPPGFSGQVRRLLVSREAIRQQPPAFFKPLWPLLHQMDQETAAAVLSVLATSETFKNIAIAIWKTRPLDFMAMYFKGIDSFGHLFSATDRQSPAVNKSEAWMEAIYQYQDALLGEILQAAPDSVNVIVVSDHGFSLPGSSRKGSSRIGSGSAVDWHRNPGVLIMAGPDIRAGVRLPNSGILDVVPTILYLQGLPQAQDLPGNVWWNAMRDKKDKKLAQAPIPTYETSKRREPPPADRHFTAPPSMESQLETLGYLHPETVNSFNVQGNYYLHSGRLQQAIHAFEQAIRLQPEVAAFHDNLGNALAAAGRLGEAVLQHRQAIALDPNQPKFYINLGSALMELGRGQEAQQAFEQALRLDPTNALGWSNLGTLYLNRGDTLQARSYFETALQLDSTEVWAHYNLGVLCGALGDARGARKHFQAVLNLAPDFPKKAHVFNNLGVALFMLQNYSRALTAFQRAISLDSTLSDIHSRIGLTLLFLGDTSGAKTALRKGLERNPKNPYLRKLLREMETAAKNQ